MASPIAKHSSKLDRPQSYGQSPAGNTIADALSVKEGGRSFNGYREGKYLLPNDSDEQDRLDLQHNLWRLLLSQKLCLAPIKETGNVLDIGTGTGIWAIQLAREYPGTNVIGSDISLIQPTHNTPPNCTFVREDVEEMQVYDKLFDLIHWRLMFSCFNNHRDMISKTFRNLSPGGWAEFHDWAIECFSVDDVAEKRYQGSAWQRWINYVAAGGAAIGRDLLAARKYKQYMIEAGFVDVVEKQIPTPMNGWPLDPRDKHLGDLMCRDWLQVLRATTKLLHSGGMPPEETDAFLDEVRDDLMDNKEMRVYMISYVVYGRKPEL